MITQRYVFDFTKLPTARAGGTYRTTVISNEGERIEFPELTGEQMELIWRLTETSPQYMIASWASNL
jgi:hypothetical protein